MLSRHFADPEGVIAEKYFGDLVIKIVEHFLPLFVTTCTAAPYRLGFSDFHPEKVLGYLPHELDHTHLRMLWRRWKKKADLRFCGHSFTPVGPLWLDHLTSTLLRLRGDYLPDVRLIDYLVALHSVDHSPALNGILGNQDQLKADLSEMGVFDSRMAIYLPYRMRNLDTYGFSGFEGRHYSLFPDLNQSMALAVNLQTLITAMGYRWAIEGNLTHADIPDDPCTESERRQIFFATAIGLPTVFIRADTGNLLMPIKGPVWKFCGPRRARGAIRLTAPQYSIPWRLCSRESSSPLRNVLPGELSAPTNEHPTRWESTATNSTAWQSATTGTTSADCTWTTASIPWWKTGCSLTEARMRNPAHSDNR
jgi:hypothetical protein